METESQPGSLGFAYVPIDTGAIDTDNLAMRGLITDVARSAIGAYNVNIGATDNEGLFGITIMPYSHDPIFAQVRSTDALLHSSDDFEIDFFDDSGAAVDPEAFTINILGT